MVGEVDRLRLAPGAPLRRRVVELVVSGVVRSDVEGLWVHRVGRESLLLLRQLLLWLLLRLSAHHLLYLRLLAGQPLDVRLQVVEGVVHGVQVLGVCVHVHVLHVRRAHRVRRATRAARASALAVATQPASLHGGEVLVQVLAEELHPL